MGSIEDKAREAYAAFVAARDEAEALKRDWATLADFYTEDGVTIDPAWGRFEGREAIRQYIIDSMKGLTQGGMWSRENWTMFEGNRVVSQWDQIFGTNDQGEEILTPGLSILYYAGDGLFAYELQLLNMGDLGLIVKNGKWTPPSDANVPPKNPDMSAHLPAAWAHLATPSKLRA